MDNFSFNAAGSRLWLFPDSFAVGCAERNTTALAGRVTLSVVRRKEIGGKANTLCSDVRYLGFCHRL